MTNPIDELDARIARSVANAATMQRINELTTHTDACDLSDPYRKYHDHDLASLASDALLSYFPDLDPSDINDDEFTDAEYTPEPAILAELIELHTKLADAIDEDAAVRQYISNAALDASLCPMHFCDYAICFDDDDPECATIRALFPLHDT